MKEQFCLVNNLISGNNRFLPSFASDDCLAESFNDYFIAKKWKILLNVDLNLPVKQCQSQLTNFTSIDLKFLARNCTESIKCIIFQ